MKVKRYTCINGVCMCIYVCLRNEFYVSVMIVVKIHKIYILTGSDKVLYVYIDICMFRCRIFNSIEN